VLSQKQMSEIILCFLEEIGFRQFPKTEEYYYNPKCGKLFDGDCSSACIAYEKCKKMAKIAEILNRKKED